MTDRVDIGANRRMRSWSRRENAARLAWALCWPLFRFSPRPCWAWRAALLRCFGATVGAAVHVHPTVRITMPWNLTLGAQSAIGDRAILYALGPVAIGARATVSQYAHLCAGTHDHHDPVRTLVRAPITVGADAWLCADCFIGPGVQIGSGAIVGARAVAMSDVPPWHTAIGNPMQIRPPR